MPHSVIDRTEDVGIDSAEIDLDHQVLPTGVDTAPRRSAESTINNKKLQTGEFREISEEHHQNIA
jgi:hypothetical protein